MKRLDWSDELKTTLGLTHVLERVQTAAQLSRQTLAECKFFTPDEQKERIQYFKSMKRLQVVMTSQESQYRDLCMTLSDLRDISGIVEKLKIGVDPDVKDLFVLKKQVALEQRVFRFTAFLKAAGLRLCDHARELALLGGTRGTGIDLPIRRSMSDFDDTELAADRQTMAVLMKALADRPDEAAEERIFLQLETVSARVTAGEAKVFRWLAQYLAPVADSLLANQAVLVSLDLMMAKIRLAAEYGCESVTLSSRELYFDQVIHPEEDRNLTRQGRMFTPVSMRVKAGVTVISGANMSGKSVALNTILLNAMLVNMGFFPFAKQAHVPIFARYIWVGDVQGDRTQGLSTFGAEVGLIREAVDAAAGSVCLIVLDEPFRGTNPGEGRRLAGGLASYLNELSSFTLIATHYRLSDEKRYRRYQSGDIDIPDVPPYDYEQAVRMLADRVDYRLRDITGVTSIPEKALAIAGWLGLQKEILQAANYEAENTHGDFKTE